MSQLTSNKPHICIISPSFNIGGIERTVSEFANYFSASGYPVTFISLLAGKRYIDLSDQIKVIEPAFRRTSNIIVNGLYRLRLTMFIRNAVKSQRPDVVLSMSDTFNYLVIASLLHVKTKIFVGDVTKPDRKLAFLTRIGKKLFYPLTDGFIAQTNSAANFYSRAFNNKLNLRVINGAVKTIEKFSVERQNIILCAGRLSYEKGQDRLIEAFSRIENARDWKLVLTADGPFKNALVTLVDQKKLNDRVIFAGKVENIDLLYAQASIFVLPSRIEGFPNALTEAMAAGLPCICFNSFPANEIISNGVDGIILNDGDIAALSEHIGQLISNPAQRARLGAEAAKISERLSIRNISSQLLDFMFSTHKK